MSSKYLLAVFIIILLLAAPAESWWRRRRRRRSPPPPPPPPPPDTTPPVIYCGPDLTYNIAGSTTSHIYYAVPIAFDSRGTASVRLSSGLGSGSVFNEGTTTVVYIATDSAGNTASCSLDITLIVARCSSVSSRSPRHHTCTEGNLQGSRCSFSCSAGYDLVGSSSVACQSSGLIWSPSFPTCQVKTCTPALGSPSYGSVSCTNSNRFNSVCTYRCNSGFRLSTGTASSTQTCGTSGWTGITPTCTDFQSPTFGSTCPTSSIVVEAGNLQTNSIASWTAPTATDNVPRGLHVSRTLGPSPGSSFNEGSHLIQYEARDAAGMTALCSFSVVVRVVNCPALIIQPHLTISCPNGPLKGATCTFTCDTGYRLVGESAATTCQSSGTWTSNQPSCTIMQCPTITAPPNGSINGPPCGVDFGTVCRFACDTGYSLTGSASRRCISTANDDSLAYWSGTTECTIDQCQTLAPGQALSLTNAGTCAAGNQVPFGTSCSYICGVGYKLIGVSVITCGARGMWSHSLPHCQVITCASIALPAPINGVKTACIRTQETYGTTCSLSCNQGFTPTETVSRTCQSNENQNGVWSAGTITCTIVSCPHLPRPSQGSVTCARNGNEDIPTSGWPFYSTCTFGCNTGYTLYGPLTTTCSLAGSWDAANAVCNDITQPVLQCPLDTVMYADQGHTSVDWSWEPFMGSDSADGDILAVPQSINSVPITNTNSSLILPEGMYTVVYTATDNAGNVGSCSMQLEAKVTKCPGLQPPTNGLVLLLGTQESCSGDIIYGLQCEFYCETGYTLSTGGTTLRRVCMSRTPQTTDGVWSVSQPMCLVNTCQFPDVSHGYIMRCNGEDAVYRDTCEFRCDIGWRSTYGHRFQTRQCQADGSWSGDVFTCSVPVVCPGPFVIPHGTVQPSSCWQSQSLLYDTVCQFSCDGGFRRQGALNKTCTDDAVWDNAETVICIDEQSPSFVGACPRLMELNSDFGETSRWVDFEVPTGTDNSGHVDVNRQTGDPGPGTRFIEGTTTITYIATDPSGNVELCEIVVTITVHRCERLQAPIAGSVQCNHTSPIPGSQCTLNCNIGYTLSGSPYRMCRLTINNTPLWDGADTACTIVQCPSPPTSANAVRSGCSDTIWYYGTQCSYSCLYGFEAVIDRVSSHCQADGTWTTFSLVCIAIQCPMLPPTSSWLEIRPLDQQRFNVSCALSCSRQGFRVFPQAGNIITYLGHGAWTTDVSQIECIDIQAPHFTICPSFLTLYAGPLASPALLVNNVTALDNGIASPNVTCVPRSDLFDVGEHTMSCVARDITGNEATCSFQIEVLERYCDPFHIPIYGKIVGDCNNVYGSVCQLECLSGYRLMGTSEITCDFDGSMMYWQKDEPPYCQLIVCDPLSLPDNSIQVTPPACITGNPRAGTRCTFFCRYNQQLVGGVPFVLCGEEGIWGTSDLPRHCKDFIPPDITFCPDSINTARVGENETVEVTFNLPTARDNIPSSILTVQTAPADIVSPYEFPETTVVTYTFTDEDANVATCSFTVFVYDNLKPKILFCPDNYTITAVAALTQVTWDEPIFNDPTGRPLEVTNNLADGNTALLPIGQYLVVYMATNLENMQMAFCQFVINVEYRGCPPLPVPRNGAVSCLQNGYICNVFCNANYAFPRRYRRQPTQFVCTPGSGLWYPIVRRFPDCSERRARTRVPMDLMYFSGDCSDPSVQDNIAASLISIIESSPFMLACTDVYQCNIQNVQVLCGSVDISPTINRRRRRSATSYSDKRWQQFFTHLEAAVVSKTGVRPKRDADNNYAILISLDVTYNVNYEDGVESQTAMVATETKLNEKVDVLVAMLRNESLPAPDVTGLELSSLADITYGESRIICEPGYVIGNDSYHCAACSSGTKFNQTSKECDYCSRGSYQDQQAKDTCMECPPGTTTVEEGANNRSMCKEICPAGTHSNGGVVPCFKCLPREYQPQPGQTSCLRCPKGTTTNTFGSQSLAQCLGFCRPGTFSPSGLAPCTDCPYRYYQPSAQMNHCILCPGWLSTYTTASTNIDECIETDECSSSPCYNGATCTNLIVGYRCDCLLGYAGAQCQENIDDCSDDLCTNGATCLDGVTSYYCSCRPGYEGDFCEADINECASIPCQYNGICHDVINGYNCDCPSGYHGNQCQLEISSCSPNPCHNGALCHQGSSVGYRCLCTPGYIGVNCTQNINECASSPCHHNGVCLDLINSYECMCPYGFEGTHCDIDVDLCGQLPCHDSATCVDMETMFICMCLPYRSGEVCSETPCQNGGWFVGNVPAPYGCICQPGYAGRNCEIDVDECSSGPCSNGGICSQQQINGYVCQCLPGFTGDACGITINECSSNPCGAGSTCHDDDNGYICHCTPGLTGSHCQEHIDFCQPSVCRHGATCINTGVGYQCRCQSGFSGRDCETNINECLSDPCQHGGVCLDLNNGFRCLCYSATGFTGTLCEVNINDCSDSTCQHGGTCVDGIAAFTCSCSTGYTGTQCQDVVDFCQSAHCLNQGQCVSRPGVGYVCHCLPGFAGHNCQEDIDECASIPCQHGGMCFNRANVYYCHCDPGYEGAKCERNIDECGSVPCQNGATCVDRVAGVLCQCRHGYFGEYCENEVDECDSEPCLNGATCVDYFNGFSCNCPNGWSGAVCDVNINECELMPCLHGGVCLDGINAYSCHCLPGYTGGNCEDDINDCQHTQCQNDGVCIDKVADFECFCLPGYSGRYCESVTNECLSEPCQNSGMCLDQVDGYMCNCPTGITGTLCEVVLNLCQDLPCSNNADCVPQTGGFNCVCSPGYGGEMCDVDIDECTSAPCLNNGTCYDYLNGYQCICWPGYTGDYCQLELPTDFDMKFGTQANVIQVVDLTSHDLSSLSVSIWLRSTTCYRGFLIFYLSTYTFTVVQIKNPQNLRVQLLGEYINHDGPTNLCDGRWHNLMLKLQELAGTWQWRFYIDQTLVGEDSLHSTLTSIPSGLDMIFGPLPRRGDTDIHQDMEMEITGVNLWNSVWSEHEAPYAASFCRPSTPGNVFSWGEMMNLAGAAITRAVRMPSLCDDVDECASAPCESGGLCIDQLNAFTCQCPDGLEGDRCQTLIDFCREVPCWNNGTCLERLLGFICECPQGYNGTVCENELVNGAWSLWSDWSECSVSSCHDTGSRFRERSCDNPQPQNGGASCPWEASQIEDCHRAGCNDCPPFHQPAFTESNCTIVDMETSCHLRCQEGYVFITPPQDEYRCGQATNYTWNYRLPDCHLMIPSVVVVGNVTATYPTLLCNSTSDEQRIANSTSVALLNTTMCLLHQSCTANISVSNCNNDYWRVRRSMISRRSSSPPEPVKITVVFTLDDTSVDLHTPLGNVSISEVESSLNELSALMEKGEFSINYNGRMVQPDRMTIEEDTWDLCPVGSVDSEENGYCFKCCSDGMNTTGSNSDDNCKCYPECPVNTYREEYVCQPCPVGMLTSSTGAIGLQECHGPFKRPVFNSFEFLTIAIIAIPLVAVLACIYQRQRMNKQLQKEAQQKNVSIKGSGPPSASPIGHIFPEPAAIPAEEYSFSGIGKLPLTKL